MTHNVAPFIRVLAAAAALVFVWTRPALVGAQIVEETTRTPSVELSDAPTVQLTGEVDSNSPATWDLVGGRQTLFVMTSDGQPSTAAGGDLQHLGKAVPSVLEPWPGGGVWMEAVVVDEDGTWYGYYHNEIVASRQCGSDEEKVIPRIGAARSEDHGNTWHSLGVILEAPPRTFDCETTNHYFVGGLGDFSVQRGHYTQDLYFFYSTYLRNERLQGVAVARLAWADRDNPAGRIMAWRNGSWVPASSVRFAGGAQGWIYPAALPIFPAADSYHDNDKMVDAFWGPSVHWNTHLQQYVMLLSRTKDDWFTPEGIYVSFAPALDDPSLWSPPVRILKGGRWYPQVIGLDRGEGTDKVAGEWARFFMSGTSYLIAHFIK